MAYDDNPTDQTAPWINYVLVPSSFADEGDTGLTTGKDYICWQVDDFDSLTEAQANATSGSVKQIVFALNKALYDWYTALATLNAPTKMEINQNTFSNTTAGLETKIRHEILSTHTAGTTVATE